LRVSRLRSASLDASNVPSRSDSAFPGVDAFSSGRISSSDPIPFLQDAMRPEAARVSEPGVPGVGAAASGEAEGGLLTRAAGQAG